VDNCIVAGDQKIMEHLMKNLQISFKLKVQEGIHDFLGCDIDLKMGMRN
jgi:hypothetical protein